MKAIITVTGKDHVGIVASVSTKLAETQVNIVDISQTILQEYFTMILLCDFSGSSLTFLEIQKELNHVAEKENLVIRIQSEELFNAMHTL